MSSRFLAPDLTTLPPAALIEVVSYEAALAALKADALARWDAVRVARPDLPPLDTLGLETEPMTIVLQTAAYRETLLRAMVNDKARASMLAYASGSDLDHLGARFDTPRMALVATPRSFVTNPEDWESDARYRRRIQLAPEAFSCAGPRGAYIYFALSYDVSIADAWAWKPSDGAVDVMVAGANGADISDAVLSGLINRFADDMIVPLTDAVSVRRAVRTEYAVNATLLFPRGPDPNTIKAAASAALTAYAAKSCRIKATAYLKGLETAAMVGGVDDVIIAAPLANVICDDVHIPVMTGAALAHQFIDE